MSVTVFALLLPLVAAQLEPSRTLDGSDDASEKFQAHTKEVVASYELTAGADKGRADKRRADKRRLEPHEGPVLRWSNPVFGQSHGETFLWTDRGRPAALLSIYEFQSEKGELIVHHEFSSLALDALTAEGPHRWSPPEAGVRLQPLPGAAPPDDSAARRLRQMRELATQFSAEKTTRGNETRPLRLLPQPIYRYVSQQAELTDGAAFAWVEATDPEILLLIEARATKDGPQWHFAAAPLTNVRVVLFHGGREVWQVETLPWNEVFQRPDKTYAIFRER